MDKKIFKVFSIAGFEKEEKWLNQMSAKGYDLKKVSVCYYTFIESKEQHTYKLEFLGLGRDPSQEEIKAYIEFQEETGIEHIATFGSWLYFRKPIADGNFELFSNLDSKINYLKRIRNFSLFLLGLLSFMFFVPMHHGVFNSWNFLDTLYAGAMIFLLFCVIPIAIRIEKLKKERSIRE